MTGDELERLTFRHMPESMFEGLLRSTFVAHATTVDEVAAAFDETERSNVAPYYRRGKLEGLMRGVAALQDGVSARIVRTKGGWKHTQLWSGPVVLTANTTQTPCGRVEPSEARISLAQDAQGLLWPEPGDEPSEDAPLYAMLLHSRSYWNSADERQRFGHLPGSAYLAYPAPDWSGYVHRVDLFEKFPAVVASYLPQDMPDEIKLRYIHASRHTATG